MQVPTYGIPDEDNPEWTERDFAFSRRRDGSLAFPKLFANYALADLRDSLGQVGESSPKIESAMRHVEAALKEMEEG